MIVITCGQSNMGRMQRTRQFAGLDAFQLAVDSSAILDWVPGGVCFEAMRPYLGVAEAVFFWQGETEAYAGGQWLADWAENFRLFVEAVAPRPVIFAQIADIAYPYAREMQAIQAAVRLPNVMMIESKDLPLADAAHTSLEGLKVMAGRFQAALQAWRLLPEAA